MWMLVLHMEPVAGWGRRRSTRRRSRRRRLTFDGCIQSEKDQITAAMEWLGQSSSQCMIDRHMGTNNLWNWNSDRRRTQEASWQNKVAKRPRKFKCSRRRRRDPGWIGRVVPPVSTIQLNMIGWSQSWYRSVIAHEIGHFVIWHGHRSGQRICTQPRIAESIGNAALRASQNPTVGWSCSSCIGWTRRRRSVRRRGCASSTNPISVAGCFRRLSEETNRSDIPGEVEEFQGSYEDWNTSARYLRTTDEVTRGFTERAELDRPMTQQELLDEALDFIRMYDLDKDGKLSELEMLEEMLEDYDPPDDYEELNNLKDEERPRDEEKEPESEDPDFAGYEYPSKFRSHFLAADGGPRGDGALDAEELVEFFKAFEVSYLDFAETHPDEPDENNEDLAQTRKDGQFRDNRPRRLVGNEEADLVDEIDEVDEVDEVDDINV